MPASDPSRKTPGPEATGIVNASSLRGYFVSVSELRANDAVDGDNSSIHRGQR